MKARLFLFHGLFAISVILTFNMVALSTAYAPGSAYARIAGIVVRGGEAPDAARLSERANALLEAPDFRARLRETLKSYGLGNRYKEFFLERLQLIARGEAHELAQKLNDLHPEAVLQVAEFVSGQRSGAIREREREFLDRVSVLEEIISKNQALADYRAAFIEYYRDQYPGAYLNDVYRDVLFSSRQNVAGWPERALTGFLTAYRDKIHVLMNASDSELYGIFQLELVAAIEGRSAPGEKCRKSSLLWAGRSLQPPSPFIWQRHIGIGAIYQWTVHDFRNEVRKLDLFMSVTRKRTAGPVDEPEHFRNRFETIKYREERAIRKKLGVPYKFRPSGTSNRGDDYPFWPHIRFPASWKIRENYCELLYTAMSFRQNLEKRDLLLYTREMLRRRLEAIHQWTDNGA